MKFTKEDILVVREIIEDGGIVEEIPHIRTIQLDKMRDVVKILAWRLTTTAYGCTPKDSFTYHKNIYKIFDEYLGEVME